VEFLENLPQLLKKNEESAWQKASASLDASAKIYGFRVDCVHSDTFRILSSLNRTDIKSQEEENANRNAHNKKEKFPGKGVNIN
jgi:condensin complex subunit 2